MSKQTQISDIIANIRSNPRRVKVRKKSHAKKHTNKILKNWRWTEGSFPANPEHIMEQMKQTNNQIFLGVSDFNDLTVAEVLNARIKSNKKTVNRETTVLCNRSSWAGWAEKTFNSWLFFQASSSSGFIIDEENNNLVQFYCDSNSTTVHARGDEDFADRIINMVETNFDVVTAQIEWIYSADGGSVNVPLNRDRLPVEEMYPFLKGETLASYYDRYLDSSANILLLIGPPGTGKTTFIRGLLDHRNSSAIVTYDAGILEKDGFFARFIEDDSSVMVLEDSDAFLKSRSDGNTMMHRFLNVGDGLVTTKGKKMVFSTNLPSIRDIDSALIRPGRCFDVVEFAPLNREEAVTLANKLGVTLKPDNSNESYSIAEVFHQQTNKPVGRKVGFI